MPSGNLNGWSYKGSGKNYNINNNRYINEIVYEMYFSSSGGELSPLSSHQITDSFHHSATTCISSATTCIFSSMKTSTSLYASSSLTPPTCPMCVTYCQCTVCYTRCFLFSHRCVCCISPTVYINLLPSVLPAVLSTL